jgi:hypothetical protein
VVDSAAEEIITEASGRDQPGGGVIKLVFFVINGVADISLRIRKSIFCVTFEVIPVAKSGAPNVIPFYESLILKYLSCLVKAYWHDRQ